MLVEYSAVFPEPYPSQTRHLLPNQDYGAFKSIDLQDPKIEVVEMEVVNEMGMILILILLLLLLLLLLIMIRGEGYSALSGCCCSRNGGDRCIWILV